MKIHPTAIIHPTAKLHESVEVGPFCIIDQDVVMGEGCFVESTVKIHARTVIGKNNRFHHGAIIGCEPQDLGYDRSSPCYVKIGDNNVFKEGANIHRGTKPDHPTLIGNNNYFMGNFHVGHDCILGDHSIFTHGTVLAGHVTVGNYAFISGVAAVHQFCKVGDYSMIAGCSKIVKDVPPYATADGNPATLIGINSVGLKRAGYSPAKRDAIKQAYKLLFHSGKNIKQALAELKSQENTDEVKLIVKFFEDSDRGVTDHR
ncbi:MAG TPA: acyl-ACP--UDP-N-acetylglucosamine O-acyltransferase [Leptospiraceae bacterium]|jgi:UDP-N-acetylglucosamine acyltransferase|nr:acyl-ACP--UDP-N-acetylglucosamine O-acyltransferase [Leptospirales bacterium]HMU82348.1 acyl-ACP--UDP-N-acetylglucosamine O-acyltransferase [Leptospiraceae bacterium]HMX55680.1 acyl-ACP--UDP-N-acetylglucosamine O-acyltransferase [Leptospiraceae bacterium]HMY45652.1 acyl-ACP--UDP-N-acetylglucosamine O-acyltransferase [Leptospiraceae bacterium]HNE22192.1 acyl-ACP--UDP-N-acetylglucosamine O-acyltransferase [Leptospiraceae bacterium]